MSEVLALFDVEHDMMGPDPKRASRGDSGHGRPNEAKRSIHYMVDAALKYGKVRGLDDLLDSVAAFRQYKPYNALLVLPQIPAATYVLPAHV